MPSEVDKDLGAADNLPFPSQERLNRALFYSCGLVAGRLSMLPEGLPSELVSALVRDEVTQCAALGGAIIRPEMIPAEVRGAIAKMVSNIETAVGNAQSGCCDALKEADEAVKSRKRS